MHVVCRAPIREGGSVLSREPPFAAAGGLLDEVRGAGQPVLRRTCADGDLNVDDREVGGGGGVWMELDIP